MAKPAPVSSSFCMPHEAQLVIKQKSWWSLGKFTIKDEHGILLFNFTSTEGGFCSGKPTIRRIVDATSRKVLLLLTKGANTTCWGDSPWLAFHGDSESDSDLLFTLRSKGASKSTLLRSFKGK
ncbi:unnamed protein product [Calypogeia fissa]